jgi:hypothetical protein
MEHNLEGERGHGNGTSRFKTAGAVPVPAIFLGLNSVPPSRFGRKEVPLSTARMGKLPGSLMPSPPVLCERESRVKKQSLRVNYNILREQ